MKSVKLPNHRGVQGGTPDKFQYIKSTYLHERIHINVSNLNKTTTNRTCDLELISVHSKKICLLRKYNAKLLMESGDLDKQITIINYYYQLIR